MRSAVASRSDRGGGPKVKPPRERRPAKRFRVTGNGFQLPGRTVAAAVGVSRRTLYRWRCAPAFAAAVDAAHRARAKLWEAAWLAAADRRHDEAVAKVLRRVRRAR